MQRVFRAKRTNLHEKYDYPESQLRSLGVALADLGAVHAGQPLTGHGLKAARQHLAGFLQALHLGGLGGGGLVALAGAARVDAGRELAAGSHQAACHGDGCGKRRKQQADAQGPDTCAVCGH